MSDGIFALLGVARHASVRTIDSFSRTFNMPYVSLSDHVSSASHSSFSSSSPSSSPSPSSSSSSGGHVPQDTVPIVPETVQRASRRGGGAGAVVSDVVAPPHGTAHAFMLFISPAYHRALLHVVQYYGWTKVFYIYDSQEGL